MPKQYFDQGCVYWGTAALGGCSLCKIVWWWWGRGPLLRPAPRVGRLRGVAGGCWAPGRGRGNAGSRAAVGECPWPRQFSPGSGPRRDNAVLVAAWPRQPQHPPRLGVSNFDINTDNIVLPSIFALPKCSSKHIVSKPHWNWDTCPQNLLWSKCLIFVCETDCKFWCCLSVHCTCWKLKNYDLMARWPDIQL